MKIIKEFVCRELMGEYILFPTGNTAQEFNGVINLNPTAKVIWENIEKVDSVDEMIQLVLDTFEIDEETAKTDVTGFISELIKTGFIEPVKEDKSW